MEIHIEYELKIENRILFQIGLYLGQIQTETKLAP